MYVLECLVYVCVPCSGVTIHAQTSFGTNHMSFVILVVFCSECLLLEHVHT